MRTPCRIAILLVVGTVLAAPSVAAVLGSAQITEFTIPGATYLGRIITGPDGRLWIPHSESSRLTAMSVTGSLQEFELPPNEIALTITRGATNEFWLTLRSGSLARMALDGTMTLFPVPWATDWRGFGGIVLGPDGNVWFGQHAENAITKMTSSGSFTQYIIPTHPAGPSDLTVGSDGNMWFVENAATTDGIGKITLNGTITEFPLPRRSTPTELLVANPCSITSGPDGNIWFTECYGNRIGRLSPNGTLTEFDLPIPDSRPGEITPGPDGAMWFAESGSGRIGRISTNGDLVEFVVPGGCPSSVVAGPDGNIWFAEGSCGRGKVGRLELATVVVPAAVPTLAPFLLALMMGVLAVLAVQALPSNSA